MDDCLLRIFDYLNPRQLIKCESVARRWKSVAQKKLETLQSIDIYKEFPEVLENQQNAESLLGKYGHHLREISIRVCAKSEFESVVASRYFITAKLMQAICKQAKQLKVLSFERVFITRGAIDYLTQLPSQFKEFSMVNCMLTDTSLDATEATQRALIQMLQNSQNLTRFEITCRGHCSDQIELRSDIFRSLPASITDLSLSTGSSIKIDNIDFLRMRRLNSIRLQRSFISSHDFNSLSNSTNSLTQLDLTSCINIRDCSVIAKFTNLRTLLCANVRDGMNDDSLRQILTNCTKIEELNIDNCSQLTEESLTLLGSLTELRWLSASGIFSFNDRVARALSPTRIEHLCLNFCRSLTSTGVAFLLTIPSLLHLEVLGIQDVQLVPHGFRGTLVKNATVSNWSQVQLPPIPITVE